MHEKYMKIALAEAEKALKLGDFPVGCVIADTHGVICTAKRENGGNNGNELDHAEIVALRKLHMSHQNRLSSDLVVYSTMEPCLMCYSTLILNNIRTIVFAYEDVMGGGTNVPLERLNPLYSSMKITVISNIMRNESITLFKDFFIHRIKHNVKIIRMYYQSYSVMFSPCNGAGLIDGIFSTLELVERSFISFRVISSQYCSPKKLKKYLLSICLK